jgi:outer membrane translocation and assembly module TamA
MLQQLLHLGRLAFWRLVLLSSLAASLTSCGASAVRERTVSSIELVETSPSELESGEVLAGLATAEPRTLFWIERERDAYDKALLQRDLERVERFYRSRGYYDVKVVAARITPAGPHEVEIAVHVMPGPRILIRKVQGDERVALSSAAFAYKRVVEPRPGEPFEEAELTRLEERIKRELAEAGFAYVKVQAKATVDPSARAADLTISVDPGKPARIGSVRVVGLENVPESKVRALLMLRPGAPYTESEQEGARRALEELDLFSRVIVAPDLSNPEVTDVPIVVTLQEKKLRRLTLGGGTQLDSLQLETHLRSGWEHKNFLGGARRFEVSGTVGLVFFPNRLETARTLFRSPTGLFPVARAEVGLLQPALFNGRTSGRVAMSYSVRPLLYALPADSVPESEPIVGYHRPSFSTSLERDFFGERISLEPSYHLEAKLPFNYQGQDNYGLQALWVSYPRLDTLVTSLPGDFGTTRYRRDATLSLRTSVELAGLNLGGTRYFGGSVSDLKLQPEVRLTLPLVGQRSTALQPTNDLILAARFKVGFVLLPDYGESLQSRGQQASEGTLQANSPDQQKLLFRAFYSGGSASNRGYAPQAISPHGNIGFLLPTGVDCDLGSNIDRCTRPLGGFSLWEASAELRYLGLYPLGLVAFIDASDVSRDIATLGLRYPHVSVGPGLRYDTAVGLLRLDLGVRVPGLQAIGQSGLPVDGSHGKELPSFPVAFNLTLGEAF